MGEVLPPSSLLQGTAPTPVLSTHSSGGQMSLAPFAQGGKYGGGGELFSSAGADVPTAAF